MKSSPKKSSSVPQIKEKYESYNKLYSDINNFLYVREHEEVDIDEFQRKMNNLALVGEYPGDNKFHDNYGYSFKDRNYEFTGPINKSYGKIIKVDNFTYNNNDPIHKEYLRHVLKEVGCHIFTDEENIKRFYSHKWCEVDKYYDEWAIWGNSEGNKLKLTKFERKKTRKTLNPYFTKLLKGKNERKTSSLTIHLETGNIYTNIRGKIRCNDFKSIRLYLLRHDSDRRYNTDYNLKQKVMREKPHMLNDSNYVSELYSLLQKKYPNFQILNTFNESNLYNILINFFFFKKDISNCKRNYFYYLEYYPGTKKKNKKYFNMEEELIKKYGLNPKNKFIRTLVSNKNVQMEKLKWFVNFFGDDYAKFLTSIKDEDFFTYHGKDDVLSHRRIYRDDWTIHETFDKFDDLLTKKVKQNIIKIINTIGDNDIVRFKLDLLDHLRMLRKILPYFPNENLNAQSIGGFNLEHSSFAIKERMIRNPFTTHYLYRPETLKIIEEPITTINENGKILEHYPFILKTDNDYIEEGSKMRHCVGGYTHKESSIIISLRNKKATERVTCEYHISDGSLIQERSVSNGRPPEEFVDALAILFNRVNQLASYGKLNWEKKEVVPNVVNGIEVKIPETLTRNNLLF